MPVLLCSNAEALVNHLSPYEDDGVVVLIHHDSTALLHQVAHALEVQGRSQALLATDSVRVTGDGSVLLVSFPEAEGDSQPAARLHVLTNSMCSTWPS